MAATAITKVENGEGDVLFEAPTDATRAMSEEVARGVNYALQAVVEEGTGEAAQLDRPVAGKTGTTQDNGDAWFAGYTPNYVAVVWMGYPEGPEHTMTDVHGVAAVTGGSLPAQIWKAFMEQALVDVEALDFAPPPDEMLASNEAASALTLQPPNGDPGVTVNASGTGFKTCIDGWYLTFDGNEVTEPETGNTNDERAASFEVPEDATPGAHTVEAWCDSGAGAEATASAVFQVAGETTTSSSSSTTSSSTTTTRPTTTSSSTTTTRPGNGSTTSTTTAPSTTATTTGGGGKPP